MGHTIPTSGDKYGIDYTHNADNFLTNIATTSSGVTSDPDYAFDADDMGDIDGMGRLTNSDEIIYPDTSTTSHTFDYTYDMVSQLASAKASNIDGLDWMQEDFTYAKDGNISDYDVTDSDSSSAATDYTYTNSGDSDIMASATGDGAFTLSNDKNGNTTKLPTSSANDTIEYNWVKEAVSGAKSIAEFSSPGSVSIPIPDFVLAQNVWPLSRFQRGVLVQMQGADCSVHRRNSKLF